jgi:hypothetical protein
MAMMKAPSSGVKIRMYRQGHGDCFLLAFPPQSRRSSRPVFMLIDCGLKPKSEVKRTNKIDKVIADIADATGNKIDIVVVTHEHQDHVNGFLAKASSGNRKAFDPIEIGTVWLAWTEDGKDRFANKLRDRFNDTLLGLARAHMRLAAVDPGSEKLSRIEDLLNLEVGQDGAGAAFANEFQITSDQNPHLTYADQMALAIKGITNKKALKYLRDKAEHKPLFLRPDRGPYSIPRVKGTKVYAFGPPRDEELLLSLNPTGKEEFKLHGRNRPFALDGPSLSFFSAVSEENGSANGSPFSPKYCLPEDDVLTLPAPPPDPVPPPPGAPPLPAPTVQEHYRRLYGGTIPDPMDEWRRIDGEWLDQSDVLALRLNSEVNNTSLVLAIELPSTRKVLLFTGDAQRGSWISWKDLEWEENEKKTTAKDLLARTVLYKVGHHGSHNATLDGSPDDEHPNLSWMARGTFQDDFVAMIPANTKWALGKPRPWKHPLKAIEEALHKKAEGRVFRSDIDKLKRPSNVPTHRWQSFRSRVQEESLYFEYTVFDR